MGLEGFGEWIKNTIDQWADYIKPWVAVNAYQEAIILRKGDYHRTLLPGYHLKWPLYELHMLVNVKADTLEVEPVAITTLDGKTVATGLVVHYKIDDSKKFMVDNNDSPSNMRDIARAEMSDLLEDINWPGTKKKTTKNALVKSLKPKYDDMGITILDLKFTHKCETMAFKLFTNPEKAGLML